jgi:hypothetical protein
VPQLLIHPLHQRKETFMKRIAAAAAAASLGLVFTAMSASADEGAANLAANEAQCLAAGGSYSDTGENQTRVRTCTIGTEGSTVRVPGSHPQEKFTVDLYTPGQMTVYRIVAQAGYSSETTGGGAPYVTACFNSAGNSIEDFATNPNCRLP